MRQGFTLLELSIVLVIIGLIIGGVTVGGELVRQAELRKVTTDIDKYRTAISTFKLKYRALPGDLKNATDYWGAAHATPATCKTTVGSGTQTCNGDGDGNITTSDTAATYYETFRAWQQMGNAGLLNGTFTGVAGSGGSFHHVANENAPKGSLSGGALSLISTSTGKVNRSLWFAIPIDGGHLFTYGTQDSSDEPWQPLFSAAEAKNVDEKVDDGKPGLGMVLTQKPGALPNCATTSSEATAAYAVSTTGPACSLNFIFR